jgi:hypothetical protein
VLAGMALVVASCGGQQFPQSGRAPTGATDPATARELRARLLASVRRTSAMKTARLALSMKLVGFGNETMAVTGDGAIDFTGAEASLSLHGDDNGEPISVDVRVVGGTVYTRNGGKWLSTPVGATNVDMPDPTSYLAYLQGISSDVHDEGHETLRGVDTTRYRANVEFDRALAHPTNPTERMAFAQARRMLGGMQMPTTVWIDGDGRLRKMEFALDLATALRKGGLPVPGDPRMSIALELYDFGVPIHVVAPKGAVDQTALSRVRAVQADLRNALTAEKTYFVDNERYTNDAATLKQIEPSLDWGGRLKVVVGDTGVMPGAVVCLSERVPGGPSFSLADVASGMHAGTFYGHAACPSTIDEAGAPLLGPAW